MSFYLQAQRRNNMKKSRLSCNLPWMRLRRCLTGRLHRYQVTIWIVSQGRCKRSSPRPDRAHHTRRPRPCNPGRAAPTPSFADEVSGVSSDAYAREAAKPLAGKGGASKRHHFRTLVLNLDIGTITRPSYPLMSVVQSYQPAPGWVFFFISLPGKR